MKKLAYLFVFAFATVSLASCGASSSSCVSSEKYQIKNMKFENQEVVLTDEYMNASDEVN